MIGRKVDSTSFYYASTGRSKGSKSADEAAFGLLANGNENKNSKDVAFKQKFYNDMMWPERFATCVSVNEAIKMLE